ncbi:MAG: serine protease [Bdellovibrionales bacterium]|nr:serine protease [Bdellovibrionales bacterium]
MGSFVILISSLLMISCVNRPPLRAPAEVTRANDDGSTVENTYDAHCPDSAQSLEQAESAADLVRNSKKHIEESIQEARTQQATHIQSTASIHFRSQSCDDFTKLRQAAETIRGRVLNIDEAIKNLEERIKTSHAILNVVRSGIQGRHIVCIDNCMDVLRKTSTECRHSCGLSETQMSHYLPILDEEARPKNCRALTNEVAGTLERSHNRMIGAVQQNMPATIEVIKKALKDYQALRGSYQTEFTRLENAVNQFPNPQCARDYKKWLDYIRNNVRRVYRLGEDGATIATAFMVDSGTPGQALPVTAVHVARTLRASDDRLDPSTLYFDRPDNSDKIDFAQPREVVDANVREKVENGQVLNFRVTPQTHDRARDIAIGDARRENRNQFMPVISSTEKPRVGQRFVLAGFPSNRNSEFTTHDCTFKGYGSIDQYSNERTYLIYCPSAESMVSGMSGGPLIDQSGRVWGVAHAADDGDTNLIHVSPLSRSSDGRTRMGIQETFDSDDCYRLANETYERHRCRIRPNNPDL